MNNETKPAADQRRFEDALHLSLPKSARVVWMEQMPGLDDMIRAKIELDRTDLVSLLQQLDVDLDELRPGASRLGADKGQWNPRSIPAIRSVQLALPNSHFRNVGVVESGQHVTLFVMQHGT